MVGLVKVPIVTVSHQNPGVVTRRIDTWSMILRENHVSDVINDKLDDLFVTIYRRMPTRTGYMRSTLALQTGDGYSQLVVTARYARFVEGGTRNMAAQPFFFPNVNVMVAELIIAVRMMFATVR